MNLTAGMLIIITILMITIDIIVICLLIIDRSKSVHKREILDDQKQLLLEAAIGNEDNHIAGSEVDITRYVEMMKSIHLDRLKKESIDRYVNIDRAVLKYTKRLRSRNMPKKAEAVQYLGALGTEPARHALEEALRKEEKDPIRIYIANALSDIGNKESIPVLVRSLLGSKKFYRDKVNMLISDFGENFHAYLPGILSSELIEMKELIVAFSSRYFSEDLKSYLIRLVDTKEACMNRLAENFAGNGSKSCSDCLHGEALPGATGRLCIYEGKVEDSYCCKRYRRLPVSINSVEAYKKVVYEACRILSDYYPQVIGQDKYLNSDDIEIRNIAVSALVNYQSPDNLDRLMKLLREEDTADSAANAISYLIEMNPAYIYPVMKSFLQEKELRVKQSMAKILSIRIEYFIMKLAKKDNKDAIAIIREILQTGITSEVIDFLNKNRDINIENELIAIIKELTAAGLPKTVFTGFLNERLLRKCGMTEPQETAAVKKLQKDKKLTASLYIQIAFGILLLPAIFLALNWSTLSELTVKEGLKLFVIKFNYYFAFYALAINAIYLVLLILSLFNVRKQEKLWRIKDKSLLFKKKILPSISIIAPAYNEEKTIIESANSLLNLKYPDYELILVNDGSRDHTLNTLIRYFDLKRVDYIYNDKIKTKQVKGVYINRSRPKLIVVDKENGGKADALNVGINIANKEYVCGIDSDSLLEDEALLKLASLTLDEATETPALGGNILPINGCTVERGQLKNIRIPKNGLARFQMMEYIRAFMSGRLGWAKLNCLLIISGAFGLFRKERIISIGGYLTSSGAYKKDTVGEDMELVVRISRQMREKGLKYRICYSFNANCWTEVPEDLKTLKKQRYRWHRGLIEILSFHRSMLFNPRYGRLGMICMPYFYLFEMLGPLFELQGSLIVILAIVLGIINLEVLFILFISVILTGILVSVSSLLIAEKNNRYFTFKELAVLIAYSFLENLGIKQYISFFRVSGLFNMLKKPRGWEKAERKGFAPGPEKKQEVL